MSTQPRDSRACRPRPIQVRISYDADYDFLWAVRHGEAIEGPLDDEIELLAEGVYLYRRGPGGRIVGFGVEELYDFDVDLEQRIGPAGLRFDVPTLALRGAGVLEVVLAARSKLHKESTPDVVFADWAIEEYEDPFEAALLWRSSLECGELKAHFGLGRTLFELGQQREAYGHLRAYTEIVPRYSCGWLWRGKAAEAIGEVSEAARCYRRAIVLEQIGAEETTAEEHLRRLERRRSKRRRRVRPMQDP